MISNDDGYDAPGLVALHRAVEQFFPDRRIIVVAPDRGRSECGHGVIQGRDLTVTQTAPNWYHVDGLPADCVRVAMTAICPDAKLMFSGVNAGANLGLDLLVSGTMAAAREAAVRGCDAMAVSHYRRADVPTTWDHVTDWFAPVLDQWMTRLAKPKSDTSDDWGRLWNVNFPAIDPNLPSAAIEHCDVDPRPNIPTAAIENGQYKAKIDFHGRPRIKGSDIDRCFGGALTISEISPGIR